MVFIRAKDEEVVETGGHVATANDGKSELAVAKEEGSSETEERERRQCKLGNGAVDEEDAGNKSGFAVSR
jgi:hypothetical protein